MTEDLKTTIPPGLARTMRQAEVSIHHRTADARKKLLLWQRGMDSRGYIHHVMAAQAEAMCALLDVMECMIQLTESNLKAEGSNPAGS